MDLVRRSVVAGLAALLVLAPERTASREEPPRVAPPCELRSLTSAEPPRLDRMLGQVVYLDFWASWCVSCAQTFPFLNALQHDLGPRGLQVVGVTVDEQPGAALTFLAEHHADFAVGVDAARNCQQSYGVEVMPSSYLIDRRGRLRWIHRGFRPSDAAELRRKLEQLLDEPAGTVPPEAPSIMSRP